MRNNILRRLLLFSIAALTIFSCEEASNTSVITAFEKYTVTMLTAPSVVSEVDAAVYTFDFTLDDKQINDTHITIGVGSSSTATEGVDFDLVTHDVELLAFQGQDGFSVDVEVYEDFEVEAGDEEIYLTFTSVDPNGIELSETKVITIEDSGLLPQPGPTIDFTLRWEFDDPLLAMLDPCDIVNDFDMTIQTAGGAPYDDDLLGFTMATLACPQVGTLTVDDMTDGEVYEVLVLIYAGIDLGDFDHAITVYLDFEREISAFNGTVSITGFDATMPGNYGVIFTIERNGNVVTLKDAVSGVIFGEGLLAGSGYKFQTVKKPK